MSRKRELSDVQWERIAPLMPQVRGRSRPFRDHRQVVEGIVYRYRCGVAWRDLPERFGPWQTGLVWPVRWAVSSVSIRPTRDHEPAVAESTGLGALARA